MLANAMAERGQVGRALQALRLGWLDGFSRAGWQAGLAGRARLVRFGVSGGHCRQILLTIAAGIFRWCCSRRLTTMQA